mgnify:CR=1 FL=1
MRLGETLLIISAISAGVILGLALLGSKGIVTLPFRETVRLTQWIIGLTILTFFLGILFTIGGKNGSNRRN